MNYTKIIRKETKVMIVIVSILTAIIIGSSYAMFMKVNSGTKSQVVQTGDLKIAYESTNGYLNGNVYPEIMPLTNEEGLSQTGYEFSVENIGSLQMRYAVYLYVDRASYEADNPNGALYEDVNSIKYNMTTNSVTNTNVTKMSYQYMKNESGIDKYELYVGSLNPGAKDRHNLKVWLDEKVDVEHIGKYVYLKLEVQGNVTGQREEVTTYTVTFDANGGVVPADIKKVEVGKAYGELPEPTKEGQTFAGWYNSSNVQVTDASIVTATSDHILTARWQ